jgi:hypothetical protein
VSDYIAPSWDPEDIWRHAHGFGTADPDAVEWKRTEPLVQSESDKERRWREAREAAHEALRATEEEVRVTSITGGQKGQKVARLGGADPGSLYELARVFGYGEAKYARYNYLKGYPWSLSIDALFRHLLAFLAGEDTDPESGLLHTAHVAWHALTLTAFVQRGLGEDDRAPTDGHPTCCELACYEDEGCQCAGCQGQRDGEA